MKSGTKLYISPFNYTVTFQKSEDHGSTDSDSKDIIIDNSRNMENKQETLLHEVLHALFNDTYAFEQLAGLSPDDIEEKVIRILSPRLKAFLQDNKEAVKWITKQNN